MKMSKKEVRLKLEADHRCEVKGHRIWILDEDRKKIRGKLIIRVIYKTRIPAHPSIRSARYHWAIRHTIVSPSGEVAGLHNLIIDSWWK